MEFPPLANFEAKSLSCYLLDEYLDIDFINSLIIVFRFSVRRVH